MEPRPLIYQVFVDRFAGPGGRALERVPEGVDPWKHHAGGTLDGIAARLDHIASLGAGALYLTPIFRAPSNHKYDSESYEEIDPRFGGLGAFTRLAEACRARGLGLILDGVFNHVGEGHPWFKEASADPSSSKARRFRASRWRGYGHLPELDLGNDELLSLLLDGEDAIVRRWLRRGATGWRLDCANDLGFSACARARKAALEEGAEDGVIGEVMTWADEWVKNDRLDGVMSYYFRESVIGACTGRVPPIQLAHNFERMVEHYPKDRLLRSWNVLATHDTPRLRNVIEDPRAREAAFTLAFTYPGVPLVYYGEEVGQEGGADPDNRRPMSWDLASWDRRALEHVRTLGQLRRALPALRTGGYLPMPQPGEPKLVVFARVTDRPADAVIVAANLSRERTSARAFLPYAFMFDALPLVDRLAAGDVAARVSAGRIDLELEPWQVAVLVPDDTTIPGYRFFR